MCKDQELCMKLYMSIHVNNYFPSFSVTGKSLKWIREQDQKFNSCQTIPNLGDLTAWVYMQMNFETVIQYHFNVCYENKTFNFFIAVYILKCVCVHKFKQKSKIIIFFKRKRKKINQIEKRKFQNIRYFYCISNYVFVYSKNCRCCLNTWIWI